MQKIVIPSAGGYEKLQLRELESPTPKAGEVGVKVQYAGVNYADVLVRLGVYESAKAYVGWPITPGFEVSGVVESLGEGVEGLEIGDEIYGFTLFNGYSSRLCLPKDQVSPLPANFNLEQSACFPAAYMTAYHALYQIFHLPPKAQLLVHSAAGGVGSALTSLAVARGHQVTGIVGRDEKVAHVEALGASKVYSKQSPDFSWERILETYQPGFDAVFDANGYPTFRFSYQALRPTGKLVTYGSHSLLSKTGGRINYLKAAWGLLTTPRFNPLDLITDNKSVVGFNLSFLFDYELLKSDCLQGVTELAGTSGFQAPKVTVFPIEEVAKAHQFIESGKSMGKIALQFSD